MIKICVVTGTRADFGLLLPVLIRIKNDDGFELQLVVTGSHLNAQYGNTKNEIISSGFTNFTEIEIMTNCQTRDDMAISVGDAIVNYTFYLKSMKPDIVLVLGDRYEIFAFASAAAIIGIPIAHMYGGDTTEGAVDEFFRHCITKMSILHFTSCKKSRDRVIQMGENPSRVFDVGSTAVENILNLKPVELGSIEEKFSFKLSDKPLVVVTFHAVTTEVEKSLDQQRELIKAMEEISNVNYIVTKANADTMGTEINKIWMEEGAKHSNWLVVDSLGRENYLSVLKKAEMILGNSSSGLSEAPILRVPTVNIGNRQKGRTLCDSVICCDAEREAIVDAMKRAVSEEFQSICEKCVNPYGVGDTSIQIVEHIHKFMDNYKGEVKSFFDIEMK